MAYTKTIWENSPSENTPLSAENLNNIENGIEDVDTRLTTAEGEIDNLQTGWIPANETWTYASVDDPTGVITISGDVTTKYSLGMRIKFTNGGNVIYGIITAISYTSPSTTLTFLHEIDPTDSLALHLMADSAITNNYYSSMKAPFGFPLNKDKWSVLIKNSSILWQGFPNSSTWYNLGSLNLIVPIGEWEVSYSLTLGGHKSDSTKFSAESTLSTTNNSETDKDMHGYTYIEAATATLVLIGNIYKSKPMSMTSKTTLYLLGTGDANVLDFRGDLSTTIIKAVCAYL